MRKLFAMVAAACLAVVPAALAAENEEPRKRPERLMSQTVLDKHWKRTKRELRQEQREAKKRRSAPDVSVPPQLEAIAQCESGGNPRAIGGDGLYRGKYQFNTGTWQAVGGKGDPAAAPEAEQDRRAAMLYARSGPSQWPVCGA